METDHDPRNDHPANTEANRCLAFQRGWNDAQLRGVVYGQNHNGAGICPELDAAYKLGWETSRPGARRLSVSQATVKYLTLVVNK